MLKLKRDFKSPFSILKSTDQVSVYIVILVALPVLITVPILHSHRFLLFSLLPVLIFSYRFLKKTHTIYFTSYIDYSWLLFCFISLLSFFWSIDGSLIFNPSFSFIGLFLWMLIFRILSKDEKNINLIVRCLLFLLYGTIVLVSIFCFFLKEDSDYNFLGYNTNYVSLYLVSLSPFILNERRIFIRIVTLILLLVLIIILDAKAMTFAFVTMILVYFLKSNLTKLLPFIFAVFVFLLGLGYYSFSNHYHSHWKTIQFGLRIAEFGNLAVVENGQLKTGFIKYKIGDKLRIERENNKILYKKNGKTFYTSQRDYFGKLIVDAFIHPTNGEISDVKMSINGSLKKDTTDIKWIDLVGVETIDNSLVKIAPNGLDNGGAISSNSLPYSTDGWVETKIKATHTLRVLGLSPSNLNTINTIPALIYERIGATTNSRIVMFCNSLDVFLDNPLKGIGIGNWRIESSKFNIADEIYFNDPIHFRILGNHNLYSQILAEQGLLGFCFFFFPFVFIFWKFLTEKKSCVTKKTAYYSTFIYLFSCFFYLDANSYETHFSGIQLLIFCLIGILSVRDSKNYLLRRRDRGLLLIVSLVCLIWFLYSYNVNRIFMKATEIHKEDSYKAERMIESIYHPSFKTTHGFYNDYGVNRSLSLSIAKYNESIKNYTRAETFYEKALAKSPYDGYILSAYAKFNFDILNRPQKAKEYIKKVLSTNIKNYEANYLMARISLIENDTAAAKYHLKKVRGIEYKDRIDSLLYEIQ